FLQLGVRVGELAGTNLDRPLQVVCRIVERAVRSGALFRYSGKQERGKRQGPIEEVQLHQPRRGGQTCVWAEPVDRDPDGKSADDEHDRGGTQLEKTECGPGDEREDEILNR